MSSLKFAVLRIAEDVKKTLRDGMGALRCDIAEIDRKVSRIRGAGRRRNQYDESTVAFCVECVDTRGRVAAIRSAAKTKVRLEDVFNYYKRKLVARGVADATLFKQIIHAFRSRVSRRRIKELEAKRATLMPPVQGAKEYGILPPMRKAAQKLFTAAFAMLTMATACLAA